MVQRALVCESLYDLRHLRRLLPDRHVDGEHVVVTLVDDRVDAKRSFTGGSIADDKLTLTSADRHHRVDDLQAELHRLVHRLPRDNAWCDLFYRQRFSRVGCRLSIQRPAQWVDHSTKQRVTNRDLKNASRRSDLVAFADLEVVPHDHCTDRFLFEVQCEA